MSAGVQSTLTGETTEQERERPSTWMWCGETEQWVLRSMRYDWPHDLYEDQEAFIESLNESEKPIADILSKGDEEEDDEAEKVGGVYEIELSYSVDYRFTVPAWSEHEAEDRAKDLALDASPVEHMHVHTRTDERKELFEDSDMVPDDYDPYGNTPLWMAIEEAENAGVSDRD